MALDREKILQAAAKLVDRKRYDKAIVEYQKIVQSDPSDTRTLLKIGDLQTRLQQYSAAIATYNQVAQQYSKQGFQLKAIAVFKQIRELIRKHAPELAARYSHITPQLAEIYVQLGLTSDALAAYDEVATLYQKTGRDRDAVEIFQKIIALDPQNPLAHLRFAEAACRIGQLDRAIESFALGAQLLLQLHRPDDALKVYERILHFRPEPQYARAAAELYLKHHEPQSGLQALAKLQIAFQANPKDLDTLALLAQAFQVIGQPDKAVAVHIEMARIARDQGKPELFQEILTHLRSVAPTNDQVIALDRLDPVVAESVAPPPHPTEPQEQSAAPPGAGPPGPPPRPPAGRPAAPAGAAPPLPPPRPAATPAQPASAATATGPLSTAPPELASEAAASEPELSYPEASRSEDSVLVEAPRDIEERGAPQSFRPSTHAHKAILDSEAFRRLGLLDKAVEVLHIALEIDPNSVPIRQKLREILVEAGEREPAIIETLNIALIHLHNQDPDAAEPLLYEVLEIEPEHPDALHLLNYSTALRESQVPAPTGHLESYDLEGVPPSSALQAPSTETAPQSSSLTHSERRPSPEAIEEVLEEAEFFASQGLFADAEAILLDLLKQAPHHILLQERLAEVQVAAAAHKSATPEAAEPAPAHWTAPQPPAAQAGSWGDAEIDVDQVFAKFKEGVKATVDDSDAATHYDLGVAYQEMGLFSDAQSEFELASRDPQRACMCHYMIGTIYKSQANWQEALLAFQKALASPVQTADQQKNLLYEIALTYEQLEQPAAALESLQKLAQIDPAYRDVSARIRALGGRLPSSDPPDEDLDAAFENLFGSP